MKTILIWIMGAVILALSIKIIFFPTIKESQKTDRISATAKKTVHADVEDFNKKVDKYGFDHLVAEDKNNVVNANTILSDSSKYWKEKSFELLTINERQAKELMSISATIAGKQLFAQKTDTSYTYRDKYANIEYILPRDTLSKGHFNFSYNADINYAEYWKRKNFLSKKKHYIDIWISDPRATINGVKRLKFESKEPSIKVDINAAAVYADRLLMGVDGGVNIGRARIGGGYYYDMVDRDWKPAITAKLKLLEF